MPCIKGPYGRSSPACGRLLKGLGRLQRHEDQCYKDQGDGLLLLQSVGGGSNYHRGEHDRVRFLTKLLGVTLSADLRWNAHIDSIIRKCNQRLYTLLHLKRSGVPPADILTLYKHTTRSVLEYAAPVWHSSLPDYLSAELEHIQRRALRIIYGEEEYNHHLQIARLQPLSERRLDLCRSFYSKMKQRDNRLHHLIPAPGVLRYGLRQPRRLPELPARTKRYKNSFVPWAVRVFD